MKTFIIDAWEVREDTGAGDGFHSQRLALFASKPLAEFFTKQSAYHSITHHQETIIVFESLEEYYTQKQNELAERALAKLSPKEREALRETKLLDT